jgi:hypothetical protein
MRLPFCVQATDSTNIEVLQHPRSSPDLTPSYFLLLGPLKEALRGRKISSADYVKDIVQEWFKAQWNPFHSTD